MDIVSDKIYSVSALTKQIKFLLENSFPIITVEGEISNFRPASSGHWYFTIKDKNASLNCVMFRNRAAQVNWQVHDGIQVQLKGNLSLYEQRGSYQLICNSMSKAGEGDILLMLEERKRLYAEKGYFDESIKKPVPMLPQKVAIVSSPTGAALQDILQVLDRRNGKLHVRIFPAPVQGKEAASKIAKQIRYINQHKAADVIIIGRGGGSTEDLLPFSEVDVIEAVYESIIPVISAVGHEIDWAISDFAADMRAPTPSAAAELVSAKSGDLEDQVHHIKTSLISDIKSKLQLAKSLLIPFKEEELERSFRIILQPRLLALDDAKENLLTAMETKLLQFKHQLSLAKSKLEASSPLSILDRGFAFVSKNGHGISNANMLENGDRIDINFKYGSAGAEIKTIKTSDTYDTEDLNEKL